MQLPSLSNVQRRTFIKTALAGASLPWIGVSPQAKADESSGKPSQTHKILSCNIRGPSAKDKKTGNGWDARKKICADVIRAQQADLIGLQECHGIQLDYLKSQLPGYAYYGLSKPTRTFRPMNAILYSTARYEKISAGGFWLSETPHIAGTKSWDSVYSRLANWIDLKDRESGIQFRYWNAHLDHRGKVARREQARLIAEASRIYTNIPQLLSGDLNTTASTEPIQLLKQDGWIDTYTAVNGPEDPGFTYHGFLGTKYAPRAKTGKIDWIFCRGEAQPVSSEIIRDNQNERYPSDHYFLSAEVALKSKVKPAKNT